MEQWADLKGGSAPMPVSIVHACIALRKAVAVVRMAGDISQQFLHGLVKVFVAVVGHLQFVLAVRPLLSVVLFKAIALDVFRLRVSCRARTCCCFRCAETEELWRPWHRRLLTPVFRRGLSRRRGDEGSCT
jgi:hypothetical protein